MTPVEVAKVIRTLRNIERRHQLLNYVQVGREAGMNCSCGEVVPGTDITEHHDALLVKALA